MLKVFVLNKHMLKKRILKRILCILFLATLFNSFPLFVSFPKCELVNQLFPIDFITLITLTALLSTVNCFCKPNTLQFHHITTDSRGTTHLIVILLSPYNSVQRLHCPTIILQTSARNGTDLAFIAEVFNGLRLRS